MGFFYLWEVMMKPALKKLYKALEAAKNHEPENCPACRSAIFGMGSYCRTSAELHKEIDRAELAAFNAGVTDAAGRVEVFWNPA